MAVTIARERPDSPDAVSLVTELETHLERRYPAVSRHGYSVEHLLAEGVHFFMLRSDGIPAGCGGVLFVADADGHCGEIKRMYVRPEYRGAGFGGGSSSTWQRMPPAPGFPAPPGDGHLPTRGDRALRGHGVRARPAVRAVLRRSVRAWLRDAAALNDLGRFVQAQEPVYAAVVEELRRGRKTSHWIWFIFPQIAGLGHSGMSERFAITSLDEARAYLAHPVLGPRLRACAELVLATSGVSAEQILGSIDAMKLRSSMTLFHRAAPDEAIFAQVLERFFDGRADDLTDERLSREPREG